MKNSEFGDLVFNTGWKAKAEIKLFGTNYNIIVKAKAYFEKDGITREQEIAFSTVSYTHLTLPTTCDV